MSSFSLSIIGGVAAISLTCSSPASEVYALLHPDEYAFLGAFNNVGIALSNTPKNNSLESKGYRIDWVGDFSSDFSNNFDYSEEIKVVLGVPKFNELVMGDKREALEYPDFIPERNIKQVKLGFAVMKVKEFVADAQCEVLEYPDFVPERNIKIVKLGLAIPKVKEFVP